MLFGAHLIIDFERVVRNDAMHALSAISYHMAFRFELSLLDKTTIDDEPPIIFELFSSVECGAYAHTLLGQMLFVSFLKANR